MSEKINLPRIFLCMIILSVLFLGQISCSEQGVNTTSEQGIDISESLISEDVKEVLSLLGFNPEGAKEIGDYFVVEDDVAISKRIVEEGLRSCSDIRTRTKSGDVSVGDSVQVAVEEMKQWATNSTVVGINKVANMTYKIDSSIPSNRHGIIHQAVNIWNNVSGSRLELTENSSADITIYAMNSSPYSCLHDPNALGAALFPENGNPGNAITLRVGTGVSDDDLRDNATHELGHAFGFRHTDWRGNEDQTESDSCGSWDAVHIAHTPSGTGNPDPNSIMNRGQTLQGLPLTTYDERALRVMYPNSYSQPQITELDASGAPGEFFVSYPLYNTAQSVQLWVKKDDDNWWHWATYTATGHQDIPVIDSYFWDANTVKFRIRLANYSGDYYSSYSNEVLWID